MNHPLGAKGISNTKEVHAFVVDDDAKTRALLSNVLVGSGFIPHLFDTGSMVEPALAKWAPDVLILDLSLGDSDAIEVIQVLATWHFGGYVLLVSGHDSRTLEEVRTIGERRGLTMLPPLQKPLRVEALRERLKSVSTLVAAPTSDLTLAAALQNNWLELWYQPKIDLRTMLVCGAEGLIRLRHPTKGVVLPNVFLPAPGDTLYRPLTDFITRRALGDWSMFAARRMINRIAINVPASVLQRPDFVSGVRRHLPDNPSFPGLIVEITEDEAITDPELAREIAVQLKLYNILVSIDDFGSGYSSLARLNELPFAEIKLDRRFVDGCSSDSSKRSMCEAVMKLAHRFDMVVVAEGVETKDDLRVLIEMGFPVAQGFLFAKAMPADEFAELLLSRARVA